MLWHSVYVLTCQGIAPICILLIHYHIQTILFTHSYTPSVTSAATAYCMQNDPSKMTGSFLVFLLHFCTFKKNYFYVIVVTDLAHFCAAIHLLYSLILAQSLADGKAGYNPGSLKGYDKAYT